MNNLCFIGGDKRQIRVIDRMGEIFPQIKIYGFEKTEKQFEECVCICERLEDALYNSDIVICPLPCTTDGESVSALFSEKYIKFEDVLKQMSKRQILLAGKVDGNLKKLTEFYKINCIDYLQREELAFLNAIPTAEGALEIAIRETPFTINGSKILILGNGRIGKTLAKMADGIGAKVTVCVRKYKDVAFCRAMGYGCILFEELCEKISEYDIIFNTVPYMVLKEEELKNVQKDGLIIDLASKPGGVEFETAKRMGIKTIWALSLPGKVAPDTAGDFVAETIKNIIRELEV